MGQLAQESSELATRVAVECKSLRTLINGNVSTLDALNTTEKTNLVGAINEVFSLGGGTELTSYATQIATLGDYPATFPADHAPVTVTGDGISLTGQQLSLSIGTGATQVAAGNDSRFTDARTPTAHKTSHATGGSDALSASDIGAVATTGNETIAGAKTFWGQMELTGQAATNDTSAMTRALGDARYFPHVLGFSTSDETVTNSASFFSSTSVAVTLPVGTWFFEAYWEIQTTATTGVGSKHNFRFTGTASSSRIAIMRAAPSATSPINQSPTLDNGTTSLPYMVGSVNGSLLARVTGRIVVTVEGILEVQFAQNTASAGNSATLKAGSYILARKIA